MVEGVDDRLIPSQGRPGGGPTKSCLEHRLHSLDGVVWRQSYLLRSGPFDRHLGRLGAVDVRRNAGWSITPTSRAGRRVIVKTTVVDHDSGPSPLTRRPSEPALGRRHRRIDPGLVQQGYPPRVQVPRLAAGPPAGSLTRGRSNSSACRLFSLRVHRARRSVRRMAPGVQSKLPIPRAA